MLDYSNFTVSLRRHNRLYTLTPRCILTDKGNFLCRRLRLCTYGRLSSESFPPKDKAARRAHDHRADQHAKYSDCLDLDPKLVLTNSCANARKSIKQGCRAFLVLVIEDISRATLAAANATAPSSTAATATPPAVSTASSATGDPEQAYLPQHVDVLKQQHADMQ